MASTTAESYVCSFCEKSFSRHHQYTAHITKHVKKASGDQYVLVASIEGGKVKMEVQSENCRIPNKRIKASQKKKDKNKTIRKRSGKKTIDECRYCGKVFSNHTNFENHIRTHTGEKPFQCNTCEKAFTEKSHLTRHYKTHTGEKKHNCDQCEMSFTEGYALKNHMRIHSGEKPYQCDICNMYFAQDSNLKRHIMTHTGEKPYKCIHCSSTFAQKGHLDRHLRSHAQEKPYECNHCEKSFTTNTDLIKHMRVHSGEKPYHCSQCDIFFSQNSSLNRHLRRHSGMKKCDHCEKIFLKNSGLKAHMELHSVEKTFQSDKYSKDFPQYSDLTKYSVVFSLGKSYKCRHCSSAFVEKGELNRHLKTHSKDKLWNNQPTIDPLSTDSNERPYNCNQNEPSFSTNSLFDSNLGDYTLVEPQKKVLSEIGTRLNFFQELSLDEF